jgi:hypothetical protein
MVLVVTCKYHMARVLAELLGAVEPAFRQQIARLEQAAGLPSADIKLMMQVINETRAKIRELGLDPHDTTGQELYASLQERLRQDESRVRESLGVLTVSGPTEILDAVKSKLEHSTFERSSFVIKQSVMRLLLKKLQPKSTMKKLGYRSMDSMLKHEPVAQLLAASLLSESKEWHRKRLDAYKKLTASDFESKKICFYVPIGKQWPKLAHKFTDELHHNILTLSEIGAVILLPLEQDLPGLAITTTLLAIQSVNDIRAQSSYLKLQQVRPDFGTVVYNTMMHEPMTEAELAGEVLPWKIVQWFYGHGHSQFHPDVFEPHVQPEDLVWHNAEDTLFDMNESLGFWKNSQLLALLDDGQPVSMNLLDVALNVCNQLEYPQRVVHHMRSSLNRELLARYLHQDNLQALLLGKLDQQLAPEVAFGVE